MQSIIERVPPQAREAEEGVLGSLLVAPYYIDEVSAILKASDFYSAAHATLYETILALHNRGQAVDLITVTTELRRGNLLGGTGSYEYLMDLMAALPTPDNAVRYAELVASKARARKAIDLGTKIVERGFDEDCADPLAWAATEALEASTTATTGNAVEVKDAIDEVLAEIDAAMDAYQQFDGRRIPGRILTGLYDLDQMTLGAGEDHLIIIAARPGVGKSTLLMQVARQVAEGKGADEPLPVLVFSLEMGRNELLKRLACSRAGVSGERVTLGFLGKDERFKVGQELEALRKLPMKIDDSSNINLARIRAEARRYKAQNGGKLGGIFVDYLQLMGAQDDEVAKYKRGESVANRQEEIAKISRGLKMLARELGCPVYAASQLNRAVEGRSDKRPMLSDLRESGAIEQDANQVWAIYRDELYNAESPEKGIAEVLVLKNRGGQTGKVRLGFDGSTTSFFDLAFDPPPADFAPSYYDTEARYEA